MELPALLHDVPELAVQGVTLAEVQRAAETLSGRYRAERLDGQWHVPGDLAARAYLLTRLPATFAAVAAAMRQVAVARPDFAPTTLLDVGAGPGTALWAALATWASVARAELWEGSPSMREWGERLSARLRDQPVQAHWQAVNLTQGLPAPAAPDPAPLDLVTLAYVLNELPPGTRQALIPALWDRTADTLLIVEPGTPAGWTRLLEARGQLLALGAHLLAPCPHTAPCPVTPPDWCHFAQRVARSRLHRQGKGAELNYEDEKFCCLAVSRQPGQAALGRVLAPPHARSGLVELKLCTSGGQLERRTYSRRQGDAFKAARKLDWGDAVDE